MERCMDILVGYGIGPRAERIVRFYWEHLPMVARAGRYHVTRFKVHQGVTNGDLLSPIIFKMVVEKVIIH